MVLLVAILACLRKSIGFGPIEDDSSLRTVIFRTYVMYIAVPERFRSVHCEVLRALLILEAHGGAVGVLPHIAQRLRDRRHAVLKIGKVLMGRVWAAARTALG